MGMLTRYQKAGGFVQILQLIETCGKQKQDNFLKMIEAEDKRWADAIKEKMLTIEKIFSWEAAIIAEISAKLQELTIATAMHGLKQEEIDKMLSCFTHSQRRNIEDLNKAKESSTAEISSAFLKIITEVRKMITQGYLRAEKFAPECVIPESFEEKLGKSPFQPTRVEPQGSNQPTLAPEIQSEPKNNNVTPIARSAQHGGHGSGSHASDAEVSALRNKLINLQNENTHIKSELKIAKEKLEQIKRIA